MVKYAGDSPNGYTARHVKYWGLFSLISCGWRQRLTEMCSSVIPFPFLFPVVSAFILVPIRMPVPSRPRTNRIDKHNKKLLYFRLRQCHFCEKLFLSHCWNYSDTNNAWSCATLNLVTSPVLELFHVHYTNYRLNTGYAFSLLNTHCSVKHNAVDKLCHFNNRLMYTLKSFYVT